MAKVDPFDVDEGKDDKAADKAAAESLKAKIAEKADSGGELEVDVEKVEDELPDLPERQQESRNERRRNRYREAQERERAASEKAARLEAELQRMQQMYEMSRSQPPPQPQPPPKSEVDALDEQLQKTFAEQDMLYRDWNARQGQVTPQEAEEFNKRSRQLQREMMSLNTKIEMQKAGIRPVNEQEIRNQILREQMMREHGDVVGNQQMAEYFQGAWLQLRAKGKPDDWGTLNEAAEVTRRAFGKQTKTPQPPPSESYRRRLTGMGRGASGGGDGEGPVVTMNAVHKQMANAAFRHIKNEAERYKRWAAGPGRRLLEKKQAG